MHPIPLHISIVFILATLLTLLFFYLASGNRKITLIISIVWLTLQAIIPLTGFYQVFSTPPRFILAIGPPLLLIIGLFCSRKGRHYIDNFDTGTLTLLHFIRIPVEMVLFWLFMSKLVPQIMTYEGRNFDILSGMTAPLIYYFGFIRKRLHANVIILWNFICLLLLANIVGIAILSVPTTFQKFGHGQPNIAVMYFPFTWLACFVVPVVLFSHLATIRQLLRLNKAN